MGKNTARPGKERSRAARANSGKLPSEAPAQRVKAKTGTEGSPKTAVPQAAPASAKPTEKFDFSNALTVVSSVASIVGTVAAVSWSLRIFSGATLVLLGCILWLQRHKGRRWRDRWMLAALICGLAGCAGFVYTFVPRDGQQPLSAKNSGLPVIFTVGNVVGDLGSFATSSPIDLNSQQLSALNSMNESSPIYSAWFASRHIIYTDKITIELQAQGNRNQTVRIINIFPVEKCTSPLTGTLFYNPPQGEDMSAQLSLDLNNPTKPAGFQQPGSSMIIPDYFGRYSISLPDNGQQTFEISAAVANRSCQFTLDADLIVNNQTVTETISNNGQPFAVTAQGEFASYRALYLGGPTSESLTGGKTNQYQDDLWIRENPKTYK